MEDGKLWGKVGRAETKSIRSNSDDIHLDYKVRSLLRRARFPTIKVAVTRTVRSQVIPVLLTQAWDWVVQNIHQHPERKTQVLSAVGYAFAYQYGGYEIMIRNLVEVGGINLQDLLTVLASTHDQMDEGQGFGIGVLNIFNGARLIANGLVGRGRG